MSSQESIREEVRRHYAAAAVSILEQTAALPACGSGSDCCGGVGGEAAFGEARYDLETAGEVPAEALLASLGCGNPTAVADLHEGEVVLDLGSGGGIDALLSARRVGPSGRVYGLDMTEQMLELARANAARAGAGNVEFLAGLIEDIPLPAQTVDVVISNCVINLSADKAEAFAEMYRVLRPGGRVGVSDVVASDHLTPEDRARRGSHAGCIAGALSFEEYDRGLREAGFDSISIRPTHPVADGLFAAIVRAVKPAT